MASEWRQAHVYNNNNNNNNDKALICLYLYFVANDPASI